jgi:hypothetical protein
LYCHPFNHLDDDGRVEGRPSHFRAQVEGHWEVAAIFGEEDLALNKKKMLKINKNRFFIILFF